MKNKLTAVLILVLAGASWHPCQAVTPLGDREETDTVKSARTYHIMFASQQEAQASHRRLAGLKGAALFEQFQQAARAESRDQGSAAAGGDLGVIQEGEMLKSFEQGLFSLTPRTLSAPIKSDFGWHLIYATDFKEEKVADICAASLRAAVQQASAQDREGLAAATEAISSARFASRISGLLGASWGAPMKDSDGNLTFIRTATSKTTPHQATAVIHTEYSKAVLSTQFHACRRSARQEFLIDCRTGSTMAVKRSEFEGRAAAGRNLLESPASGSEQPRPAAAGSLGSQLVAAACRRT